MNDLVRQGDAPEPTTMFAILARAAADPSVDVDKLLKLKQMVIEDEARQAEKSFNDALSACQAQMGTIGANKTNSQTHSKYATYDKLDKAVRPIYTSNGFSLSFDTGESVEGFVNVRCYVSHKAGHTRTYSAAIPSDGKGARGNDVMTKTHAVGSGMSYGMRYLLKMIFNIAIGEHDDDGNAAGNTAANEAWHLAIEATDSIEALRKLKEKIVAQNLAPAAMRSIHQTYNRRLAELKPKTSEASGEEE